MKAMMLSDLVTSKSSTLQLLGVAAFVGVFIAVFTEQLVTAVGCIAAMVPFMYLFSVAAYDEQNGWERFRLTLPLTRRQVAYGRYASMAIVTVASLLVAVAVGVVVGLVAEALPADIASGHLRLSEWGVPTLLLVGTFAQTVILLAAALSMPVIMRYGMTKGSRLIPVVLVLAFSFGAAFFGTGIEQMFPAMAFQWGEQALYLVDIVVGLIAVVLYCASAVVAARLYERREL